MITDSMTYQEIAEAMRKDWYKEIASVYESCFGMRQKYGRHVLKRLQPDEFFCFESKEKITKNKNKYVFLFYTHGRREYKKSGIIRNFWLEYLRSDGIHAVKMNPFNNHEITFYTPHLFDRYRERFLEVNYDVDDWNKRDVMEDYFIHNEVFKGVAQDNEKYPGSIFITTSEGVVLGVNIGEGIWEYRTYISFEMLKSGQIEQSQDDKDVVDKILDLKQRGKIKY